MVVGVDGLVAVFVGQGVGAFVFVDGFDRAAVDVHADGFIGFFVEPVFGDFAVGVGLLNVVLLLVVIVAVFEGIAVAVVVQDRGQRAAAYVGISRLETLKPT